MTPRQYAVRSIVVSVAHGQTSEAAGYALACLHGYRGNSDAFLGWVTDLQRGEFATSGTCAALKKAARRGRVASNDLGAQTGRNFAHSVRNGGRQP